MRSITGAFFGPCQKLLMRSLPKIVNRFSKGSIIDGQQVPEYVLNNA